MSSFASVSQTCGADVLTSRFEKLHPAPAWATEARRKVLKKRSRPAKGTREDGSDEDEDEGEDEDEDSDEMEAAEEVDDLFRSTGGKKAARKGLLKAGEIDIDRVRDANQAEATSVSWTGQACFSLGKVLTNCFYRGTSCRLASTHEHKCCFLRRPTAVFVFSRYGILSERNN